MVEASRRSSGTGVESIASKFQQNSARIPRREHSLAKKESVVVVEGREIKLSNLDKVLYPKVGFTKRQVTDYYVRVAPVLLPHLSGRPLTLKRYPEGVEGMHFYEKNCPSYRPEWMKTAKIWSPGNNKFMYYC